LLGQGLFWRWSFLLAKTRKKVFEVKRDLKNFLSQATELRSILLTKGGKMTPNLKKHLTHYLSGFSVPKVSPDEAAIVAEEIQRMVNILEKTPNIGYSELWNKIHEIED